MKKRRILYLTIISVLAIGVITSWTIVNKFVPHTVYREASYTSEVLKPEFLKNTSDVVVVGKVSGKTVPSKGLEAGGQKYEIVYTDTKVIVEKVINDKIGRNIKPGDTLVVRSIGGTAGNLTMKADTESIMKQSESKALLFLVDSSKDLSLPENKSNSPVYVVVGGFHGSFNLTSDGIATREVSGDKFKFDDLIKPL